MNEVLNKLHELGIVPVVENHQEQDKHKYYNYIKCKKQRVTVAFVRLFIFRGSILWKMRSA